MIGVLLYPKVYELEVAAFVAVLRVALQLLSPEKTADDASEENPDAAPHPLATTTLAKSRFSVVSASGLVMTPHAAYSASPPEVETLVIPGCGDSEKIGRDATTRAYLQRVVPTLGRVICLSSGAMILGEAGLLRDVRTTTAPGLRETLWRYDPSAVQDDAVVQDGKHWFGAHAGAAVGLALALVQERCGDDVAQAVVAHLGLDPLGVVASR